MNDFSACLLDDVEKIADAEAAMLVAVHVQGLVVDVEQLLLTEVAHNHVVVFEVAAVVFCFWLMLLHSGVVVHDYIFPFDDVFLILLLCWCFLLCPFFFHVLLSFLLSLLFLMA